jgi:hypothetical protein
MKQILGVIHVNGIVERVVGEVSPAGACSGSGA